jgi:S-adenosylmethionine decarboxylase
MSDAPPPSGIHLIADLSARRGLDDPSLVGDVLRAAAAAARVTLLDLRLHHFGEHQGVTGVALLAESHISIHTWPESGLVAVDIFVCGPDAAPQAALDVIVCGLDAHVLDVRRLDRLQGAMADEESLRR